MRKNIQITFLYFFLVGISVIAVQAQAPNFQWAKNATGINAESGECIAVDGNGNVIVGGHFSSATLTFGANTLTNNGFLDVFLTKYDALGNVLWAKSGGGIFFDYANSVVTDNNGNIYVCGNYYSPTMSIDNNTLTSSGGSDGFIVKYNSAGNIVWIKNIGGDSDDKCNGIAADQSGNIYITGSFQSSSLVCESFTLNNTGTGSPFVAKYNGNGNIIWARSFESTNDDAGKAIAVDGNENVFITGLHTSPALIIDSYTLSNSGNSDVFVTKLNSSGNAIWAKAIGGMFNDTGSEIALDPFGNVYVAGDFNSANFIAETFTLVNTGNFDFFIAKFDGAGNPVWAKAEGDINDEVCTGISTDINANLYITGHFHGVSLSLGANTLINNGAFGGDMFLAKYGSDGNILWATSVGGGTDDGSSCMATDFAGNVYVSGFFASTSIVCSSFTLTSSGNADMFVGKLESTITGMSNSSPINNKSLSLYPNPSGGVFKINSDGSAIESLEIFNDSGELIFICKNPEINPLIINLTDKAKGIYLVKLTCANKIELKKLIIQ